MSEMEIYEKYGMSRVFFCQHACSSPCTQHVDRFCSFDSPSMYSYAAVQGNSLRL